MPLISTKRWNGIFVWRHRISSNRPCGCLEKKIHQRLYILLQKMLDRSSPPVHYPVTGFELITPRQFTLANGLKVFVFDAGEQDVVRMEWIFEHSFAQGENTLLNSCAC